MGAIYLINNLVVLEPALSTLEAQQNILNELLRVKRFKQAPYLTIRRAINIQRRRINKL